jgi:hypothetical protein
MRLAAQLDISGPLGFDLASWWPLFVLPRPPRLSVETVHPWAAVFLPLHVVISGFDRQSEIHIPTKVQSGRNVAPPVLYAPVLEAQPQLFEAVEAVATRSSVLA